MLYDRAPGSYLPYFFHSANSNFFCEKQVEEEEEEVEDEEGELEEDDDEACSTDSECDKYFASLEDLHEECDARDEPKSSAEVTR